MLVVHIIIGLNVGGAELMLRRLCESLTTQEDKHVVVSLTKIGKVGELLQSKGIEVVALNLSSVLTAPIVFFRLMRLVKLYKPDIVQTWMYHADFIGGLAAYCVGVKNIIWGVRTTDVKAGGNKRTAFIRSVCARLSFFIPRFVVCAADASRRAHIEAGYDARRMVVIANGFDLSVLSATEEERMFVRSANGISNREILIGSVGRFNVVKDHHNFIKAAGFVASRFKHVKFLLVGRDLTEDNDVLIRLIAETGFSERFVLLGERTDVPACLKAMDIFCLHSVTEGFPNVLGEAMSMGLPCVTTDVGDASLLIGNTGYVVPPKNANRLSEELIKLVEIGQEKREEMGAASKQRIVDEFTMDVTKLKFKHVYDQLCN